MNNECKIKDDDEILMDEQNRFNFRRFTPEEIEKKNSPFERVSKKKEINFLFQKNRYSPKIDAKISLEHIMNKIETLDLSGNSKLMFNVSNTPKFSPFSRPVSPLSDLTLNDSVLKKEDKMELDG